MDKTPPHLERDHRKWRWGFTSKRSGVPVNQHVQQARENGNG